MYYVELTHEFTAQKGSFTTINTLCNPTIIKNQKSTLNRKNQSNIELYIYACMATINTLRNPIIVI